MGPGALSTAPPLGDLGSPLAANVAPPSVRLGYNVSVPQHVAFSGFISNSMANGDMRGQVLVYDDHINPPDSVGYAVITLTDAMIATQGGPDLSGDLVLEMRTRAVGSIASPAGVAGRADYAVIGGNGAFKAARGGGMSVGRISMRAGAPSILHFYWLSLVI
jgi:hypothetical protein